MHASISTAREDAWKYFNDRDLSIFKVWQLPCTVQSHILHRFLTEWLLEGDSRGDIRQLLCCFGSDWQKGERGQGTTIILTAASARGSGRSWSSAGKPTVTLPRVHLHSDSWLHLGQGRKRRQGAAVLVEAVVKVQLLFPHSTWLTVVRQPSIWPSSERRNSLCKPAVATAATHTVTTMWDAKDATQDTETRLMANMHKV